jgi:hypothetical protein
MDLPYKGYKLKTIKHPHFDNVPTLVCAVDVSGHRKRGRALNNQKTKDWTFDFMQREWFELLGGILVCRSDFDELGAGTIRKMNCQHHAEIIVVPDEKYKVMTASEKMDFLQQNLTKLVK